MSDLSLIELISRLKSDESPAEPTLRNIVKLLSRTTGRIERDDLETKQQLNDDTRGWVELIKDIVSMSNLDGGVICFGIDRDGKRKGIGKSYLQSLDSSNIQNKSNKYLPHSKINTTYHEVTYYKKLFGFLICKPFDIITIFEADGNYPKDGNRQGRAFSKGVIYTRVAGGNREARQIDLNMMIEGYVKIRMREFLAKIEPVATLPAGTDLIAVKPNEPSTGYILKEGGEGVPVRISYDSDGKPVTMTEVLDPNVPFASLQGEVAAQTRQWKHGDASHRVKRSMLIRWYLGKSQLDLSDDMAEFCFISAGYGSGYPMYWASKLSKERLYQRIEIEAQEGNFSMRHILPYVIGGFFWSDKRELIQRFMFAFPRRTQNSAHSVLNENNKTQFLKHCRLPPRTFTYMQQSYSFDQIANDIENAAIPFFERLLNDDMAGSMPANSRKIAHQLDVLIHARKVLAG